MPATSALSSEQTVIPGSVSGCRSRPGPPSTQGPFARSERYPSRRDIQCHVSGHYSTFIATTSPCVRPNPSRRFRFPYTAGLCRLSLLPAGKWPFPTLSPQSLYGRLDPYPVASLRCICPFLPERLRLHLENERFSTPSHRRKATPTTGWFSGLQSFHYVQAPIFARPPGCTHR